MQQRLGADVGVEESHRAARLGQAEPHADEVGLVAHQHRHALSLLQLGAVVEDAGQPVAARVHVAVRVDAAVVDHERLVRDALRLLDEAIQDRAHAGGQPEELQLQAVAEDLEQKAEVAPHVREAAPLEAEGEQQPGAQRRHAAQAESHAAAVRGTRARWAGSCDKHALWSRHTRLYKTRAHTHRNTTDGTFTINVAPGTNTKELSSDDDYC